MVHSRRKGRILRGSFRGLRDFENYAKNVQLVRRSKQQKREGEGDVSSVKEENERRWELAWRGGREGGGGELGSVEGTFSERDA